MERLIIYNQKRFPHQYEFNTETLKWEYKDKTCDIRLLKTVNDLRYAGWGLQGMWDLSLTFSWGWIHKTFRRKDDSDISKVIDFVNKKLKKYDHVITDDQWDKIKKDFVDHMDENADFLKYAFDRKQGYNNGFNSGFLMNWDEYIVTDISRKEKI